MQIYLPIAELSVDVLLLLAMGAAVGVLIYAGVLAIARWVL